MHVKITFEKILYIVVSIVIVVYLLISLFNNFDFKKGFDKIKDLTNELSMSELYEYIDKNSEYYYKIEGATYCISKEELKNDLSEKFINNMKEDIIEVTYKNSMFTLKYNKECTPN